jgi:hypothetical protein
VTGGTYVVGVTRDDGLLLSLLEDFRRATHDTGAHTLIRYTGANEPEVLDLPHPHPVNPLLGLSHVPLPGGLICVRHTPDRSGICFLAFVIHADGSDTVYTGESTGPLSAEPDGLRRYSLQYLMMSKIAWGQAMLPRSHTPDRWLLLKAFKSVVDAVEAGVPADIDPVELSDGVIRQSIARDLRALLHAENPLAPELPNTEWATLCEYAPFLGRASWDELDTVVLAKELGYSSDVGRWWTARGIGCLEQIDMPEVGECLAWLEIEQPLVAEHLRMRLDEFGAPIDEAAGTPADRWRARWRGEDPASLVVLANDITPECHGQHRSLLVGYLRNDTMQLSRSFVIELTSGPTAGVDFTSVRRAGPADGVMLFLAGEVSWSAVVLNREGVHGTGSSAISSMIDQFAGPSDDPELVAALRRVLTGRATFDSPGTPFEWLSRRVLFGLARTLETGRMQVPMPTPGPNQRPLNEMPGIEAPYDAESGRPRTSTVIDVNLIILALAHATPLVRAAFPSGWLEDVQRRAAAGDRDEALWDMLSTGVQNLRSLHWADLRVEPIAEAWSIPLDEAEWWRAEGIGPAQIMRLPDETESMLRCCYAIRGSWDRDASGRHLIARIKQLFGEDVPVLWSFLPDYGQPT